jgi:hypothetical protein
MPGCMYLVWELLELSNLSTAVFCSDCRNHCLDGGTELSQIEYAGQGQGRYRETRRFHTLRPTQRFQSPR